MKNKFCRDLFSLTFMTLLFLQIPAQQKALKIGDMIPEEVWKEPMQVINHPQNKSTITLSEHKDQLILLDFWATWCGSCLKNFKKMHELEKQFEGRVKIIPVTEESSAVLNKFFSTPNGKRYSSTSSVKEDEIFHQLFPHKAVPYIIWIKNGKLINTTDADQVTEQTVSEILNKKTSSLQTVIQVDRSRPFMLSENFDLEKQTEMMSYSILSKGRIRGAAGGTVFRRKGESVYGRLFSNMVLLSVYRGIAYEMFSKNGQQLNDKRILKFVKNPEELIFDATTEDRIQDSRYYTFDFIDTASDADSLYPNMLKTLNRTLPYMVTIEEKIMKCWIISKTNKNVTGKAYKDTDPHSPMKSILSILNVDERFTPLPVIDETGISGNIGIDIKKITGLAELKKVLAKHNLQITEEERKLMMLVIRDK